MEKNITQITFYNSGIGTYAQPSWTWSLRYWLKVLGHKIDLGIAWCVLNLNNPGPPELLYSIEHNIRDFESIMLAAYEWLSENYQPGDRIFLFGMHAFQSVLVQRTLPHYVSNQGFLVVHTKFVAFRQ